MNSQYSYINNDDGELELFEIFKFFKRNKFLIIKILIISIIFSFVRAYTSQRIWKGQFQIVLKESVKETPKQFQFNQDIINLLGINKASDLETEVEILKSPSVLFENFNFVKKYKIDNGENVESWRYSDWLKFNLGIKLRQGTSVLNVTYKDSDKDLIMPVLNKISKSYQKYSSKDRKSSIDNGIEYLDGQIKEYKLKSEKSSINAEKFAFQNDLMGISNIDDTPDSSVFKPKSFDNIRVSASAEIRRYKEILEKINSISSDDQFYEFVKIVYPQNKAEFKFIDDELIKLSSKFKDNDPSVIMLKKRKLNLIRSLREKVPQYFKAQILKNETIVNASKRPEEVIIKYQTLLKTASRDSKILDQLINQSRILKLEKQKYKEPWQLITSPTLFPKPIEPKKKRIVILGGIFGILISLLVSYLKENKEGKIYASKSLMTSLGIKKILNFSDLLNKDNDADIKLLANNLFDNFSTEEICLVSLGKVKKDEINDLVDKVNKELKKDFLNSDINFYLKQKNQKLLLITKLGYVTKKDIEIFKERNKLSENTISNCLLI